MVRSLFFYFRRRPKRHVDDRKRRLQQRLNSLSFYDSIPIYDSVGRRGRVPGSRPHTPLEHSFPLQSLSTQNLDWTQQSVQPPYWSTMTSESLQGESDHDSAIYAEVESQSRVAAAGCHTPSQRGSRATRTSTFTTPASGSTHKINPHHRDIIRPQQAFSLRLKAQQGQEDIYTHV